MTDRHDHHDHNDSHRHEKPGMDLVSHHGDDDVCLNQVSFAYDGQFVVENVTLHAPHGTTLGIIGPNGSGKTTLLKLMLGLLRPNAGTITVLGMSPAQACARGDLVGPGGDLLTGAGDLVGDVDDAQERPLDAARHEQPQDERHGDHQPGGDARPRRARHAPVPIR